MEREQDSSSAAAAQPEAWHRLATRCGALVRRRVGVVDAAGEARILRAFRAGLRPRGVGGRRVEAATLVAAEAWVSGMAAYWAGGGRVGALRAYQRGLWQSIYRVVIAEFGRLDKLKRQYRTGLLRRNVKAYLRRQGRNGAGVAVAAPKPGARKGVVVLNGRTAA